MKEKRGLGREGERQRGRVGGGGSSDVGMSGGWRPVCIWRAYHLCMGQGEDVGVMHVLEEMRHVQRLPIGCVTSESTFGHALERGAHLEGLDVAESAREQDANALLVESSLDLDGGQVEESVVWFFLPGLGEGAAARKRVKKWKEGLKRFGERNQEEKMQFRYTGSENCVHLDDDGS